MKSNFYQVWTARPIKISFSLIFFRLDLGERSFYVSLISNCICFLDFKFYLLTIIYSRVTFIHQRGDLSEIITFPFNACVQFGVSSVYMRKSVKSQRKYRYIYYLFTFCPRFLLVIIQLRLWFLIFTPGVYNKAVFVFDRPICHFKSPKK